MVNESTVRRKAQLLGYYVTKSRQRNHVPNLDNYGEYMLIEASRSLCILGPRYDATLDYIESWLDEYGGGR